MPSPDISQDDSKNITEGKKLFVYVVYVTDHGKMENATELFYK